MFKIKKISNKTSMFVGAYFRYTKAKISKESINTYKLTKINYQKKRITFSWYDPESSRIQFFEDWCSFEEFNGYLEKGIYTLISENEVDIKSLKSFKH